MKELYVCVGSSCHLKGSYQVVKAFETLIKKNNLQEKLKLKASFCQGKCMSGIAVLLDDVPIENVTMTNADQIFFDVIMQNLS